VRAITKQNAHRACAPGHVHAREHTCQYESGTGDAMRLPVSMLVPWDGGGAGAVRGRFAHTHDVCCKLNPQSKLMDAGGQLQYEASP
jgi:hypothetical protein